MVELFLAGAALVASLAVAKWMHGKSVRAAQLMTDEMLLFHIAEADDWGESASVFRAEHCRRQALQSAESKKVEVPTAKIDVAKTPTVPSDAPETVEY